MSSNPAARVMANFRSNITADRSQLRTRRDGKADPFMFAGCFRDHLYENLGGSTVDAQNGVIVISLVKSGRRFAPAPTGQFEISPEMLWEAFQAAFDGVKSNDTAFVPAFSREIEAALLRGFMEVKTKEMVPRGVCSGVDFQHPRRVA